MSIYFFGMVVSHWHSAVRSAIGHPQELLRNNLTFNPKCATIPNTIYHLSVNAYNR